MMIFSNKINITRLFSLVLSSVVLGFFLVESLSAETRYRVKSSDNINSIVEKFYKNSDLSKGQLFVGILAKNPRAFKGGNINFLLRGKRLTLPNERELRDISPEKAKEILSKHARLFRRGRTGKLAALKLSDIIIKPTGSLEPSSILEKQKAQSKQIEQLQRESNALQEKIEDLINQRSHREKQLLELEELLKQTQNKVNADVLVSKLDQSNKPTNVMKDTALQSVENTKMIQATTIEEPMLEGKRTEVRTIELTDSFLPYLIWLVPLVILLGVLLFIVIKSRRNAQQVDEFIEIGDSGYIETPDDEAFLEDIQIREDQLETSIKLDVARAYIEAEDVLSAREMLSEIMKEGTSEQRQIAQELLNSI